MRLFSNDKYLKIYISSSLIIIIISLWIAEVRKAAWPGDGGGQRSHRKEGKKRKRRSKQWRVLCRSEGHVKSSLVLFFNI